MMFVVKAFRKSDLTLYRVLKRISILPLLQHEDNIRAFHMCVGIHKRHSIENEV